MEKVYVKQTKDRGNGIFARRNIKKGELIVRAKGKIFHEKDVSDSGLQDDHFMQIDWHTYMFVLPPTCYANHSCNPNSGIKDRIKLVALKDIKKDEEITVDYDTFEYAWTMKCICGSKNCRKIIRGYKYLPAKIKARHKGFISDYLLKP